MAGKSFFAAFLELLSVRLEKGRSGRRGWLVGVPVMCVCVCVCVCVCGLKDAYGWPQGERGDETGEETGEEKKGIERGVKIGKDITKKGEGGYERWQ